MHSDWSITQNVNKRADWLTLFALVTVNNKGLKDEFYTMTAAVGQNLLGICRYNVVYFGIRKFYILPYPSNYKVHAPSKLIIKEREIITPSPTTLFGYGKV